MVVKGSPLNCRRPVDSIVGEGTSFNISFPVASKEDIERFSKIKTVIPIIKNRIFGRALVVDDEDDIREILMVYLEGFGLDVDEACDGFEGLNKVNENDYDYIISDLTMPKMDGENFIKKARKVQNSNTKFVTARPPLR